MSYRGRAGGALLLPALGLLDLLVWSGLADARRVPSAPASPDLADLVVVLCAWLVTLGISWLSVLAVLVALEPVTGRDLASRAGCPRALRRVLLALCGAAVLGTLVAPAQAATPHAGPSAHARATDNHDGSGHETDRATGLDGLPLPDRATAPGRRASSPASAHRSASSPTPRAASPSPGTTPRRASPPAASPTGSPTASPTAASSQPGRHAGPRPAPSTTRSTPGPTTGRTTEPTTGPTTEPTTVVVRPGQCLWSVARDRLRADGATATPAAVDSAWRAVYAANRDAVGPDPDVLRPGTRLRVPDPLPPAKETDR